ncbi:5-oxoprolinase subunit C family protein [Salinithrix halophila]|uniref:Biotin-dependent carboxyltransferase family protein n=1 Tax=Salinithrix halophila TaxID=1485204 RepID=A0ABV8J9X9_9BACL
MNREIQVLKSGLLTTVQDLGRTGYQQYGMVVAGAMDSFSFQVANLLLGNRRGEAGLEITITGPVLYFGCDIRIALTGGDLGPKLDGEEVPMWRSLQVKAGQILSFSGARQGMRAYLAVAGGIAVEPVMGSKSTYIKGALGGWRGRKLKEGDRLPLAQSEEKSGRAGLRLAHDQRPVYRQETELRVVMGPQNDAFTSAGVKAFLSSSYEVTPQSDRMGYRLKGPTIRHRQSADILSDATAPGSVQVPADGQPIVLMADRQTTGGYAKVATVISVDIPLLAQAAPGHKITFRQVDMEEAQQTAIDQERLLRKLEAGARGLEAR